MGGLAEAAERPFLMLDGVSKDFGAAAARVTAVDRVSLSIQEAEFVALLGPSGCGKSTVLNMIAGLEIPSTGAISIDGESLRGPGRDRGVVFQSYTLMPWLTARKNVELGLLDESMTQSERAARVSEFLTLVGLDGFADHLPKALSGGMRQRVAIARSLAYGPRVLLMDEPFGALDAITRQEMQLLLLRIWQAHRITVVFVTHDIDEAILLSDRIFLMSPQPGRIRSEIPVRLPRPRATRMMAEPAFNTLKMELLNAIGDQGAEHDRIA